ncbi:hypothetical protein HHK36_030826 [Tetracentron sinense]|uniref:Pentatricopeptide repeat-containing protein n=1 Tax=Tetracentron sinense TaxID=13715 RepID=A0A834YA89_TETSI|nr:hypothetical protein HHK36_030826 [Tetracentron sinense]
MNLQGVLLPMCTLKLVAVFMMLVKSLMGCLKEILTWNVMISEFAQDGDHREVVKLFSEMQVDDGFALVNLYGKCSIMDSDQSALNLMVRKESFVWSSIISGYARKGSGEEPVNLFKDTNFNEIGEAEDVFRRIPDRDIVAWNSMIMGYAQMEEGSALSCIKIYRELRQTTVLRHSSCSSKVLSKWEKASKLGQRMADIGGKKDPESSQLILRNEVHEFMLGVLHNPEIEEILKTKQSKSTDEDR